MSETLELGAYWVRWAGNSGTEIPDVAELCRSANGKICWFMCGEEAGLDVDRLEPVEFIGAKPKCEDKRPKAYLYHAWSWDCEQCGGANFCRSIHRDHDEGPTDELPGGWRDNEEGQLIEIAHPNVVTCQHCQATYTADVMGSVESDDSNGE